MLTCVLETVIAPAGSWENVPDLFPVKVVLLPRTAAPPGTSAASRIPPPSLPPVFSWKSLRVTDTSPVEAIAPPLCAVLWSNSVLEAVSFAPESIAIAPPFGTWSSGPRTPVVFSTKDPLWIDTSPPPVPRLSSPCAPPVAALRSKSP